MSVLEKVASSAKITECIYNLKIAQIDHSNRILRISPVPRPHSDDSIPHLELALCLGRSSRDEFSDKDSTVARHVVVANAPRNRKTQTSVSSFQQLYFDQLLSRSQPNSPNYLKYSLISTLGINHPEYYILNTITLTIRN